MLEEFSRWDSMVKAKKLIVCSFSVKSELKNEIVIAQKADPEYNFMKLEAEKVKNRLSVEKDGRI